MLLTGVRPAGWLIESVSYRVILDGGRVEAFRGGFQFEHCNIEGGGAVGNRKLLKTAQLNPRLFFHDE